MILSLGINSTRHLLCICGHRLPGYHEQEEQLIRRQTVFENEVIELTQLAAIKASYNSYSYSYINNGGDTPGRVTSNDLAGRSTALDPPCPLLCFGDSVKRKEKCYNI